MSIKSLSSRINLPPSPVASTELGARVASTEVGAPASPQAARVASTEVGAPSARVASTEAGALAAHQNISGFDG